MKKNCSFVPALFAAFLLTPLCIFGADLTTPRSAAKSFGDALQNGDEVGVKDASINGKPELIRSMCDVIRSNKVLHDAATAQFGSDGESLGIRMQTGFAKQLDNAKVAENGDSATITAADGKPVTLKKLDGEWKLDFASIAAMELVAKALPMMSKMAAANREVADEITAGKFPTVAEAKNALAQKMMATLMPTTQPK